MASETQMDELIPDFMSGMFLRNQNGYFYPTEPPLDLKKTDALKSHNGWIVLAAVLELAKSGDFLHVHRLIELQQKSESPFLSTACFELLGDIGTEESIDFLLSQTKNSSTSIAIDACQSLYHIGFLEFLDPMVAVWERLERPDDRDIVAGIISEMLGEGEDGPIYEVDPTETSVEVFRGLVDMRAGEVEKEVGGKKIPVLGGHLFGVNSLARLMYNKLRSSDESMVVLYSDFLDFRQRFESSTGINCSCFYEGRRFLVSEATALLESVFEGRELDRFQEGVRYFFGHEIPQ